MPKFKVNYTFEGSGVVEIEADNAAEAREKFYEGEFSDEKEDGQNYEVDTVEKPCPNCENGSLVECYNEHGTETIYTCDKCATVVDSDSGSIN